MQNSAVSKISMFLEAKTPKSRDVILAGVPHNGSGKTLPKRWNPGDVILARLKSKFRQLPRSPWLWFPKCQKVQGCDLLSPIMGLPECIGFPIARASKLAWISKFLASKTPKVQRHDFGLTCLAKCIRFPFAKAQQLKFLQFPRFPRVWVVNPGDVNFCLFCQNV